jgi:hypothetical protein
MTDIMDWEYLEQEKKERWRARGEEEKHSPLMKLKR